MMTLWTDWWQTEMCVFFVPIFADAALVLTRNCSGNQGVISSSYFITNVQRSSYYGNVDCLQIKQFEKLKIVESIFCFFFKSLINLRNYSKKSSFGPLGCLRHVFVSLAILRLFQQLAGVFRGSAFDSWCRCLRAGVRQTQPIDARKWLFCGLNKTDKVVWLTTVISYLDNNWPSVFDKSPQQRCHISCLLCMWKASCIGWQWRKEDT